MCPKNRNNFAIAIICALPLEADAVEALFDEHYDRLGKYYSKQQGDANAYINGRIGKHDVVLCYMPEIGKRNAASVASSLRTSYPSVKLALVVGICGGVPPPPKYQEIFLGDVIISDSVVEYDFGRQYPGGFQQKTGVMDTLGRPGREIRALLNGLRAENAHSELQNQMQQYLHILQQRRAKWHHPKAKDILFSASYLHKHYSHVSPARCSCFGSDSPDNICEAALALNCDDLKCNEGQAIRYREVSEAVQPSIYIGTVASADMVMKSGQHRDEIVGKKNIIGFEMEGAGVWDNIPCIIIKGVCDYADSHKNKEWQGYAAAAGAAAAKAFLEYWGTSVQAEKPPICRNIPFARNARFLGREEQLQRLESAVFSEPPPSKIAITGLGGVGKTQIALELAYRVKEKAPECSIIWIPAMSTESIQEAYNEIAQNIGLSLPREQGANVRKLVQKHFSNESAGRWIMVFDSADDRNVWNKLRTKGGESGRLTDWLPQSEQGCIIFTTRTTELAGSLAPQSIREDILEMRNDTAVELLRSLIHDNNPSEADLQVLAKELTYLPLALVQAAAYMAQTKTSPARYLGLLQTQEQHRVSLLSKEFEDDGRYCTAKNPVMATWLISFDEIKKSDSLATEYLSLMCCVEPRHIPEELLPQTDLVTQTNAIGTLKAYAFVNEHLEGSFLSLHRLVHLAARSWLRAENRLTDRTAYTCERLNDVLATPSSRDRSRWRSYLSHAQYLLDSDMISYKNTSKRVLRWKLAVCLHEDARYLEAESCLLDELRSMDQDPSSSIINVTHFKSVLARNLVYQGKFDEAEKAYKELVNLANESHDPSNRQHLDASINLATFYAQISRWKEAESQYLMLKENHEKELDSERVCQIDSNLARLYLEQGKWDASATLFSDVVKRRKSLSSAEDLSTLISQAGHSTAKLYLGLFEEALNDFIEIEKTLRKGVGKGHRVTLAVMAKVALAYKYTGQLDNAKQQIMQVIELSLKNYGKDNPATLSYQNILAQVYLDLGQFSKAEQVVEETLPVLESKNIKDIQEISWAKYVLASSYRTQGKLEDAENIGRSVLEARTTVLGPEHPDTLSSMADLADTYTKQNHPEKAEDMYQRALAGMEKALGTSHAKTRMVADNLASLASLSAERRAPDPKSTTGGKRRAFLKFIRRR